MHLPDFISFFFLFLLYRKKIFCFKNTVYCYHTYNKLSILNNIRFSLYHWEIFKFQLIQNLLLIVTLDVLDFGSVSSIRHYLSFDILPPSSPQPRAPTWGRSVVRCVCNFSFIRQSELSIC